MTQSPYEKQTNTTTTVERPNRPNLLCLRGNHQECDKAGDKSDQSDANLLGKRRANLEEDFGSSPKWYISLRWWRSRCNLADVVLDSGSKRESLAQSVERPHFHFNLWITPQEPTVHRLPFRTVVNDGESTSSSDGSENRYCGIRANGETPLFQRPISKTCGCGTTG